MMMMNMGNEAQERAVDRAREECSDGSESGKTNDSDDDDDDYCENEDGDSDIRQPIVSLL